MKASWSWLNDYVTLEMEANRLADALTMVGLEVEAVFDRYAYLKTVHVGRVLDVQPHPNADQLHCCRVDLGDQTISVVCGAPNVRSGILVPTALPGTTLPEGLTLEKTIIRGAPSEGMLCSEGELGLGTDRSGIMLLEDKHPLGIDLATALNRVDPVFEIDLTPNRPDCLSIIGIAREIAAIQHSELKYPQIKLPAAQGDIHEAASVVIEDPDHCPRYTAGLIEGITVGDSPFWLQDRLLSVGLRPINNMVDVTNFVMMEYGQPLHAFDFDRLSEHRIVVRTAHKDEAFTTLDGIERKLADHMLLICDGRKPVAIGGVMGGLNSEIEASTTNVLIESAYFNPASIRKTSKMLGLPTESSHRFERGVDPHSTARALERAAQLMAELGSGQLIGGIIDAHPQPQPRQSIALNVSESNRLLGTQFDLNETADLLQRVEFDTTTVDDDQIQVIAPSFRVDVTRPVDLMEEIARLSGYNNIPLTYPLIPATERTLSGRLALRERIKNLLTGFAFTETINYSFMRQQACDLLRLPDADPRRQTVPILNPLTEEHGVMRTSLLPGMLGTVRRNFAQQVKNLKLFEIGRTYLHQDQARLPDEPEMLIGVWTGAQVAASWHSPAVPCDFFDIKGVLEGLLHGLKIAAPHYAATPDDQCAYIKPGNAAYLWHAQELLGLVGEVHPEVLANWDLKQPIFMFEIILDRLYPLIPPYEVAQPLSKFPSTSRDMTIIVDQGVASGAIVQYLNDQQEPLVENISLFDVFQGAPIPAGKKSLSLRVIYRSFDTTLEDEQVNQIHQALTGKLLKEYKADLPA